MRTLILSIFILGAVACTSQIDQVSPCAVSSDTVRYFTHVYPIIDRTCSLPTCHVNGSAYGNFKNPDALKNAATSGKLEFMINSGQMPPGNTNGPGTLTDCEITIIRAWINNGALVD